MPTEDPKRPGPSDSPPPDALRIPKRSKLFPASSKYRDEAAGYSCCASNYPKAVLNQKEDLLVQALVRAMDSISVGEKVLCFDYHRVEKGFLKLNFSNGKAKEWFRIALS